jgi:hypothetical protein
MSDRLRKRRTIRITDEQDDFIRKMHLNFGSLVRADLDKEIRKFNKEIRRRTNF